MINPESLANLHAQCFSTPRPWSSKEFEELLLQTSVHLVSNNYGFIVGMLMGSEAELLTLAVDPQRQREGIATELLQEFESLCRSNTVKKIILEVVETNIPARKLYETNSFIVQGARKDYYSGANGIKVSAIVMVKVL